MISCVSALKQAAQPKTIYTIGRNLPTAQWLVCSTLHRYLKEYAIGARSLHSQRLRWVVTDEGNWPRAPTSTCSFFSLKEIKLAHEALRRQ